MNTHNTRSTDLCREQNGLPNDPQASKLHLVSMFTCGAFGIIIGITLVVSGILKLDPPCSAQPYCSVHKKLVKL